MDVKTHSALEKFVLRDETHVLIDHFDRLVSESFTEEDAALIELAMLDSIDAHQDQKPRPDGTPYVEHPLQVAYWTLDAMEEKKPDVVIAALLHDTVEDQADKLAAKLPAETMKGAPARERALAYIRLTYGERTGDMVEGLTNPDFKAIMRERGDTSDEYKNWLYAEHVREAIEDPDIGVIKYIDFSGNGLRLNEVSNAEQRRKLTEKYIGVVNVFVDRFERARDGGDATLNIRPELREDALQRLSEARKSMTKFLLEQEAINT